jgi:hypothetical protein
MDKQMIIWQQDEFNKKLSERIRLLYHPTWKEFGMLMDPWVLRNWRMNPKTDTINREKLDKLFKDIASGRDYNLRHTVW